MKKKIERAEFGRVLDPEFATEYDRHFTGNDGLSAKRRLRYADFNNCVGKLENDALVLDLQRDGASLECVPQALGLPNDWELYEKLRVTVEAGAHDLKVHLNVFGRGGRLRIAEDVPAGMEHTLELHLGPLSLVNQSRDPSLPLYVCETLRLLVQWGDSWPSEAALHISDDIWPATVNNPPTVLTIKTIELVPYDGKRDVVVIDRYGQQKNTGVADRIRCDQDFIDERDTESEELKKMSPPARWNKFGSLSDDPAFEATGFFRVDQDAGGRWWYVDPEGQPHWAIGFCGVRTADPMLIEGKEQLFEELPERDGPYAAAYEPLIRPGSDGRRKFMPGISFYGWNILRKYGSREAWAERVLERFRVWGVNSIGNWSTDLMVEQHTIPHTRALMARLDDAPKVAKRIGDAFTTKWADEFDRAMKKEAAPHKDNPWLLGYFVDNEMPWGGLYKGGIFDCDDDSPLRDAFVKLAAERYNDVRDFNKVFVTEFPDWDAVRRIRPDQVPQDGDGVELMHDLAGIFAERYFSEVRRILKKHDPNHMYLGARFVRGMPDRRIVEAAGRHCDVMSVNCYSLWPHEDQFGTWYRTGGRPIQLGEYALPIESAGTLAPPYPTFPLDLTGQLFREMGEKWARQPWSLGFHWYTHQAAVGKIDRPRQPMVDNLRYIAANAGTWHRGL